jgi:hypothetical protein
VGRAEALSSGIGYSLAEIGQYERFVDQLRRH